MVRLMVDSDTQLEIYEIFKLIHAVISKCMKEPVDDDVYCMIHKFMCQASVNVKDALRIMSCFSA